MRKGRRMNLADLAGDCALGIEEGREAGPADTLLKPLVQVHT